MTEGNRGVQEASFTGTQTGVLRTPAGEIPPTGRRVNVKYVTVAEFAGGKYTRFHIVFDSLELLTQLGVAPAPAGVGTA